MGWYPESTERMLVVSNGGKGLATRYDAAGKRLFDMLLGSHVRNCGVSSQLLFRTKKSRYSDVCAATTHRVARPYWNCNEQYSLSTDLILEFVS